MNKLFLQSPIRAVQNYTDHGNLQYTLVTDILQEDSKVRKERLIEEVRVDGVKDREAAQQTDPRGTFTMPKCNQVDKNEVDEWAKLFIKQILK
ncbi:MAG: hypothetical protein LJE75_00210 [Gammaproteobacteria bacterium]|jgi:hypothetical protein|nr:hypothetical protein [Gammaproteobacteria bacterium]